jgi:hypothetical protein
LDKISRRKNEGYSLQLDWRWSTRLSNLVSRGCKGKLGRRVDDTDHGIHLSVRVREDLDVFFFECVQSGKIREFHILSVPQLHHARQTSMWNPQATGNWGGRFPPPGTVWKWVKVRVTGCAYTGPLLMFAWYGAHVLDWYQNRCWK